MKLDDVPADEKRLDVLGEGAGDVEDGEEEVGGDEDGAATELLTLKGWKG